MRTLFHVAVFALFFSPLAVRAQSNIWVQSNGPYGGFVNSIAQTVSGKVLAGTFAGIFESSDLGQHWSKLPALGTAPIYSLVAASDGTVLAAAGNGGGIFYSRDNGVTWAASTGLGSNYEDKIIRGPSGSYFAIGTDVYKSTDEGASWFLSGGSNSPGVDAICQDSSGVLYATNFGTFLISTDQGNTWTPRLPGLTIFYCNSLAADEQGNLYAATDSLSWRSTDQGRNWTPMNVGSKSQPVLVYSTVGKEVFGAGVWEFYQSSDAGVSWSSSTFEAGQPTGILSLDGSQIVMSTLSGVETSSDGGANWARAVNGMTNTMIGPILAKASGDVFAAAAAIYGGVYHSSDNGGTWTEANVRSESYAPIASMALLPTGSILAGTRGSGLFRTSNNAASWQQVGSDLPDSNVLCLAVTNETVLAGTLHRGAFLSTDSGNHWSPISGIADTEINTIAADSSGTVYIAAGYGDVYRSLGTQASWASIAQGNLGSPIFYSSAVTRDGTLFVAGQFTLNSFSGGNWNDLTSALPNDEIISLTTDADTLYASFSDSGIYRTTDFGASWQTVNDGLANRSINSLAISPDGYLFAGTYGDGVFRSGALRAGVSNPSASQNGMIAFPNPCSGYTHLQCAFENGGNSTLTVMNALGETVAREQYTNSEGGVDFNTSALPSGVYRFLLRSPIGEAPEMVVVAH